MLNKNNKNIYRMEIKEINELFRRQLDKIEE
jgi:hypothetical protein